MVGKVLNRIKAEIKSEPDDTSVEITAQDVAGGEEFEEATDEDSSLQGSLEIFELNFQNFLGRIKEESIDIKSDPEDEPVVGITAQDVAGVEEIKEESDDDSSAQGSLEKSELNSHNIQGSIDIKRVLEHELVVRITAKDMAGVEEFKESQKGQTDPEIQADDQSEASVFYDELHGYESLVTNFKSAKSQLKSESVQSEPKWSTLYKTKNSMRLDKKDKPQVIKVPLSEAVNSSEYTILGSKRVQCNYCLSIVKYISSIRRHIGKRHRDTFQHYKCPFCPYTMKHYNPVLRHIVNMHKKDNDLEYFECHTCGKRFELKSKLKIHMKTHKTKEELLKTNEIHKCQQCPKMYRDKYDLSLHTRNYHNKNKELVEMRCYHCSYKCKDKRHFIYHIQKCHTPVGLLETLKCLKCDFTTRFYAELKRHRIMNHSHSIQCEKCSFESKCRTNLKLHRMIHQKKKAAITKKYQKYECNKCDYQTYRKHTLKRHNQIHLKPAEAAEIQYLYCYHCNFKAKMKNHLILHIKRHSQKEEV